MHGETSSRGSGEPSLVRGAPLGAEPGLGALTIPGYLREVTQRFAGREAVVFRRERDVERWTYATLWERSLEVAGETVQQAARLGLVLGRNVLVLERVGG